MSSNEKAVGLNAIACCSGFDVNEMRELSEWVGRGAVKIQTYRRNVTGSLN